MREITETGMLDDPRSIGGTVDDTSGAGLQLAIDDFGTGYSSLSRLVTLPADILEVERTFVRELHGDQASAAVVSAVLLLGAQPPQARRRRGPG